MSHPIKRALQFGPYSLDPDNRILSRQGVAIHLPGKAFDLLALLAENQGRLLDKDELLEKLWPGTFVEEGNLAQHISTLRRALEGQGGKNGQTFIETVPRRGYRFIAEVCESKPLPDGSDVEPTPAPGRVGPRPGAKRLIRAAATGLIVTALLSLTWYLVHRVRASSPPIRSIAVLPLSNLSGDPSQEYFAEGLTDALITELAKIHSLRVISRTSSMQYKDQRKSLRQIARELHVDAILEGSVIRSPQRVRISIQLIDPQQDRHLWVETYERPLSDLISLEGQVATDIAIGIKSALTSQERARIGKSSSTNIEAQEHYLRGRFFWNKRTEAGYVTAIEYFRKAIASSPSDPRPYAGLADAYALLGSMDNSEIPRKEAMLNAREAALAALHLDDSLAEAHTSLAFVKMHYEWDWVTAEREFQRAIDLNPSYATAHHWYAYDLMAMRRPSEALREIHRARELDPLSLIINTDVAELLYYTGQMEEALREVRGVLAMDPDFALAHRVLGFVYLQKREYAKALSEFRRQQELTNSSAWAGSELAVTYAAAVDLPAAEAILNTIISISNRRFGTAGEIAGIYAALGRKDEAFKYLEQAYVERNGGLILLDWDPTLASLKTDPRFAALVRRIGLPP